MKNTIKLKAMQSIAAMLRIAGIIAFVAIIGFSFTACGEEDDGGGGGSGSSLGTWLLDPNSPEGDRIQFDYHPWGYTQKGYFTLVDGGASYSFGDYTVKNNIVTFTPTTGDDYTGTISGKTLTLDTVLFGKAVIYHKK